MVDEDRDLIRKLISAQWVNDTERYNLWLKSTSEKQLRAISFEIDQIIKDSVDKVSRLNAEKKDDKKLYLLDDVQLLALQHVRLKMETEINLRVNETR